MQSHHRGARRFLRHPHDRLGADQRHHNCGNHLYPTTVRRAFKHLLAQCELPDIRTHDLRHTAATLMLARGVNIKVVSEMLGHSNVSTTLSVYAHVTEGMQEQATVAMGQILFD